MSQLIFNVKISPPPTHQDTLQRTHVYSRLDHELASTHGFARPLTLVAAPAGFGKTTLVRNWLREAPVVWYNVDEHDNERTQYWLYLVSAVQTRCKEAGRGTKEILRNANLGPPWAGEPDALLAPLLNDLYDAHDPFYLVIDDYHMINDAQIHEDMAFFIQHLPPTVNLVVTTRSDPPWPLARWRVRRQIAEVRQRDLKLSKEETRALLTSTQGPALDDTQMGLLYEKTEGWVAGVALAAFSLANTDDLDGFVASFSASNRHVLHFLCDEVLQHQTKSVQQFLLMTSILRRFCGPLCDYVMEADDSSQVLAQLEKDHVFVIPLDQEGRWYRYHSLFADFLYHQLKAEHPGRLDYLHQRAAEWFYEAGDLGEAVRHYLKCQQLGSVAAIIDHHMERLLEQEGFRQMVRCLEALTPQWLTKHPLLIAHKAWFLLVHHGADAVEPLLELADSVAEPSRELQGMLALVRAYCGIYAHDITKALGYAEEAWQKLPDRSQVWRTSVAIISGDARLFAGNPKQATPYYEAALASNHRAGCHTLSISSGFKLATALYFRGKLKDAEQLTRQLLDRARVEGLAQLTRVGLLWTLLGDMQREKGNIVEAEELVDQGLAISYGEKPSLGWNYLFKIQLRYSQGKAHDALQTIDELESLHRSVSLPSFISFPAAVWRARVLMKQEDLSHARRVLADVGISAGAPLERGQERGHLALVELHLLRDAVSQTDTVILQEIESRATQGEDYGLFLEVLLTRARLAEQSGQSREAADYRSHALQGGKEAGYYQLFIDHHKGETASPQKSVGLSARQREILHLISQGLSNQEISEKLFLSVGTVKWYTSSIYGRLGIKNRTEAAMIAQTMDLGQP